jgi:hypothetical protein
VILQPKGGMHHWIVLWHCAKFEPDPSETITCSQGVVLGYVVVVIPNITATQGGNIGHHSYKNKEDRAQKNNFVRFFHIIPDIKQRPAERS